MRQPSGDNNRGERALRSVAIGCRIIIDQNRRAPVWYKVGTAKQGGGTMPRVSEIEEPGDDPVLTQIFEQERAVFGDLLNPTKVMAHCPPILRAAKLLGASIAQSGQLPKALLSLVNFRVASINGCPF
jgi:hypothetical protein